MKRFLIKIRKWKNMAVGMAGILTAMVCLSVFTACVEEMPSVPSAPESGYVRLHLDVAVSSAAEQTRAAGEYPDGKPYDFEDAATVYEGVHSLRAILVDSKNTVVGNKVCDYEDKVPKPGDLYSGLEFRVKGGEKMKVYLIANELSVKGSYDFISIVPGMKFTQADAEGIMIDAGSQTNQAMPYIDNTGATRRYVPMTEFFEIDVVSGAGSKTDVVQEETLFVTRSLVKFAFTAKRVDGTTNFDGLRIKSITFNNLGARQYLMPNGVEYLPKKYPVSTDNRVITAFNVPLNSIAEVKPYVFTPENFGVGTFNGAAQQSGFSPQLYFCETKNTGAFPDEFKIKVEVEFPGGDTAVYEERILENLPSLPRNTVVKVNLEFDKASMTATVTLVPYASKVLKPNFGLQTEPAG